MNSKSFLILCILFFGLLALQAQETFPRNDVKDKRVGAYAFTHATIVHEAGTEIVDATLLIREGKIEELGKNISVKKGYREIDLSGKTIYPSFIDLHTNYGIPELKRERRGGGFGGPEQINPSTKGAYNANDAIKSYYDASSEFNPDNKSGAPLREAGFGTVLTFRPDGIARGTAVLVTLGEESANNEVIVEKVASEYAFNKGTSTQLYPRSMMGYISLIRQTYLDAEWYSGHEHPPFADKGLEAWIAQQHLPQIFDAGSWINILRADKVGDEFNVQYVIKGSGKEYQRVKKVKETEATLIIPVNFPEAYDVENPVDAARVSYADMLHWELAPTNPASLEKADITFALTTDGLKSPKTFLPNVRKAIKKGLTKEQALRALTTVPAKIIGADHLVGKLEKGKIANFLITDGDIFDEKTMIYENWIQGRPYKFKSLEKETDHKGKYELVVGDEKYNVEIEGKPGSQLAKIIVDDTTKIDVSTKWQDELVLFSFKPRESDAQVRLSGWKSEQGWKGRGQLESGQWTDWMLTRTDDLDEEEDKKGNDSKQDKNEDTLGSVVYPFLAYGLTEMPVEEKLVIKNATVWTNEAEGIMEETDVLLDNGKIAKIGKNISESGARVIDGSGKHLTAGIIDEHTHIAGGGNDVATNSSMVRIGDQVNSEDINIYRGLAGGVTAAQVLHGSANPIGGQSALIKLRWGASPEELKIKGADEFIKFALGENVKRSSNPQSRRYPQTRMGVEQVYVDAFTNAREYEKKWQKYNALSSTDKSKTPRPRKNLVDEAMLEIISRERFITCHSYVQSEINMLMKVAERFDFNINTFTHILEGYKVADKMKQHGVAASSFSDWWNYKWEVRYAIPYNAAILHREGVITAINSDDANMGRRLNQEAAKSIKYGGISEKDALKFVTLNPAKMLHLDHRMGSIKVGKDADVVLWSAHPLSVYAKAEKTIVDGKVYFDIEEDKRRRILLQKERSRLVQKMIGEKKGGKPVQKKASSEQMLIHCESVLGVENHESH